MLSSYLWRHSCGIFLPYLAVYLHEAGTDVLVLRHLDKLGEKKRLLVRREGERGMNGTQEKRMP